MVSSQPEAPLSAYRKPGCAVHFNKWTSSTLSRSRTSRRSRLPTSREPALAQQPGAAGGSLEEIPIIERSRFFHGHTHMILKSHPTHLAAKAALRYDARHAADECNFAEKLSPCERDRPGWGRLSRRQSIGLADRVPDVAGQANHREGSRWHTEGTGRDGDRDVLAARLRTDGLWAARTDETSAVARQDSRRRAGLRELPLWLHGTEGPSRRAAGIRQGARPETNDYLHVWRAEGRQNGGLDARRRRRQQVRRADAESGHTTRLPQPRLRIPKDRRRTDLRQADGRVRSEAGEDAVSGERDQSGLPGGGLLREVSGPVPFDPPAGLVANGEERSRTGAGCGGLEETVCGGQEIGGEELLR